jgi:VanZ family protein
MSLKINHKQVLYTYTCILIILAVLPINGLSKTDINDVFVVHIRLDHLLHSIIYIPWPFLFFGVYNLTFSANKWLMLLLGLIVTTFTEGIQLLLTYRSFSINDLLANYLGLGLGCFFAFIWYSFIVKKEPV